MPFLWHIQIQLSAVVLFTKTNIIAEGYTSEYGGSHAEVNAINSLRNTKIF